MNSPVDNAGLAVLSQDACRQRLASGYTGRLGLVVDAAPVILPVNYRYVDGAVFVRTAPGTKLDAALRGDVMCLEIDEIDDEFHHGWSVLATGPARVLDADALEAVDRLPLRPWASPSARTHVICIEPLELSGRRL
jgi:nitroimidazol reductase NimA-like FMN-containing flavoprotein (pyridoxamine 5'-phosphate oxidase superfamily)